MPNWEPNSAGLVFWHCPAVGPVTQDPTSGRVAFCPDITGNGNTWQQATDANRPYLGVNAQSGLPALQFVAADSTNMGISTFPSSMYDDRTLFAVMNGTGWGVVGQRNWIYGTNIFYCDAGGTQNDASYTLVWSGASSQQNANGVSEFETVAGAGFDDGFNHVFAFRRNKTTGLVENWIDGRIAGTGTGSTTSSTNSTGPNIGGSAVIGSYLQGQMLELFGYGRWLSEWEMEKEFYRLMRRYRIPTYRT